MSTEHTRWIVTPADLIPAETSVRLEQIKLQSNSLKSPEPASHLRRSSANRPTQIPWGHGHGVASRRGDGVCVVVGLCIQARLEAGNCGEVFASLFPVCAVLPHQACTGGSVFSDASCPRRVCRNPRTVCGLFWTLPRPDLGSFELLGPSRLSATSEILSTPADPASCSDMDLPHLQVAVTV